MIEIILNQSSFQCTTSELNPSDIFTNFIQTLVVFDEYYNSTKVKLLIPEDFNVFHTTINNLSFSQWINTNSPYNRNKVNKIKLIINRFFKKTNFQCLPEALICKNDQIMRITSKYHTKNFLMFSLPSNHVFSQNTIEISINNERSEIQNIGVYKSEYEYIYFMKYHHYLKHVNPIPGDSKIKCSEERARVLLKESTYHEFHRYSFDKEHEQYVKFNDENLIQNVWHGYHIDDAVSNVVINDCLDQM